MCGTHSTSTRWEQVNNNKAEDRSYKIDARIRKTN